MKISPLEIEEVESKAGNIYEAVVVAAKRARQLNDEQKLEYNQRVEPLIKADDDSDDTVVSKDKMNISVEFEQRAKTTEAGLNELLADGLEFRIRNENPED
ncbi:MAG TPA: DNA-directed RNA polymerase subunit omega [Ignavibacteria bacterium]|nr:DNA-directed RNA polymerase subunit omega [Ignavibacteria bacterium]HAX47683.1 DNA-directed RNA polymerase subunit omega [Bacteroidota bacterium]HRE12304.1 DNA-directed RNA polymerase subunit omega [Ignavibacteria bacterium]HRF67144.1 DNA-directed RNA polymerase subunit omega [Ignavibacteria bacterium]HRJ04422.1 DNA-directed RNA polymerase subunit omega [Ignavibacteria bacterium]